MLFDRLRVKYKFTGSELKSMSKVLEKLLKMYPQLGTLVSMSTNLNFNTHIRGSGWGAGRGGAGMGCVWNSLISKNLVHYSLSLKCLLIL